MHNTKQGYILSWCILNSPSKDYSFRFRGRTLHFGRVRAYGLRRYGRRFAYGNQLGFPRPEAFVHDGHQHNQSGTSIQHATDRVRCGRSQRQLHLHRPQCGRNAQLFGQFNRFRLAHCCCYYYSFPVAQFLLSPSAFGLN